MTHSELVTETLKKFSQEQLNEIYIDGSLDKSDQEALSLESHIKNCSEDWSFRSNSMSCDIRHPSTLDDMLDYINLTLVKQ